MEVVILLGGPGSGKGTTAERVRGRLGYIHISTGDMLREAVRNGSDVGLKADLYMKRGELVPDDIMIEIVVERMRRGNKDSKYLLDGFPRTSEQATLLEKSLADEKGEISQVLFLDAPSELLMKRLTGRRICRECGINYHVETMRPKKEGVCDACGGELYQRPDDHESTIKNRLDVYGRQTESLISRYKKKGMLKRIDSSVAVDNIVNVVVDILEG